MKKVAEFVEKYGIGEEGKEDLLKMMNESLLELLKNEKKEVRYASRIASEYAKENGISIEEFSEEKEKITKKDVEELIRKKVKKEKESKVSNTSKVSKVSKVSKESKEETEISKEKKKVLCSGITKKGEVCNKVGTVKPDGAKKHYCLRHAEDYKAFECSSDSSNSESETETETEKKI
jgi:hypothetical protein